MHVHGPTWLQLAARLEQDGRSLLLNGHVGNLVAQPELATWAAQREQARAGEEPRCAVRWHDWWEAHEAKALLGDGSHGGAYDLGPERAVALHEAAVTAARAALVALSGE